MLLTALKLVSVTAKDQISTYIWCWSLMICAFCTVKLAFSGLYFLPGFFEIKVIMGHISILRVVFDGSLGVSILLYKSDLFELLATSENSARQIPEECKQHSDRTPSFKASASYHSQVGVG